MGGRKVQPEEVGGILRALPGVRDVVVLGVKTPGSAREVVRAVIACDPCGLDSAAVHRWCRERLAAHKVPRSVVLVDAVPRNARGKVDRLALAVPGPALDLTEDRA